MSNTEALQTLYPVLSSLILRNKISSYCALEIDVDCIKDDLIADKKKFVDQDFFRFFYNITIDIATRKSYLMFIRQSTCLARGSVYSCITQAIIKVNYVLYVSIHSHLWLYSFGFVLKLFQQDNYWICLHSLVSLYFLCCEPYVLYTHFFEEAFLFIAVRNFGDHCGELMCGLIYFIMHVEMHTKYKLVN